MTNPKPRVVIDGRMVTEVLHGIARYTRLLAKSLAERSSLAYEPVFLCAPGMSAAFSGFETIEMRTPFLDPKEMATIPVVLWKKRAKLYHSPSFSSLVAAPCPWIVTIHDLNHLTYGGPMERAYYETVLRAFADRAKRVITVSEFSRAEIRQWNPKLSPELVPNAIDPQFLKAYGSPLDSAALEKHGLQPGRYFICLANEKPHKNVETLVRGFSAFLASSVEAKGYRLVLSVKRFSEEPGVVSLGGLSDSEAISLIRQSRAVAFPSVYEGFGLPPLEGAILGAPVIVSDIPVHRETLRDLSPQRAGESGSEVRWVKALSEDDWAEALRAAARDPLNPGPIGEATRAKLIDRYSVERMGESMDRIYRAVLGLGEGKPT